VAIVTENQASQLARALADTRALSPYVGLLIDLYKAPIAYVPTTPLATFTAQTADFVGYAQGTVTWSLPTVAQDGTVEVVGALPIWRPTNAVTPNLIYGFFATLAVGGDLAFFGQFDLAPLLMQSALNQLEMTVRYRPATSSIVVTVN